MRSVWLASTKYRALQQFGKALEDGSVWPRPACPTCGEGHVSFEAPILVENSNSSRWHNHDAFEPEWIFGTFEATGNCENSLCRQVVKVVGKYDVSSASEQNYQGPEKYAAFLRVEYFSPPLNLLLLPEDAPDDVRDAVNRAGRLLYVDPGLAATALRASVERFLSTQDIPAADGNGRYFSLHRRLKMWQERTGNDRVAKLFFAVKWIGNGGTHEVSQLSVEDVLEGVGFIDEGFHSLYVAPDIDARAQQINAAHGGVRDGVPSV